jgi:hypothetical protein
MSTQQAQQALLFPAFNSQWSFQPPMQGADKPILPPIRTVLANGTVLAPEANMSANKLHVKSQAQLQTQQIDKAIQLLKMQYDAIMASVEKSANAQSDDASVRPASTKASNSLDQGSFAADFELPSADSNCGLFGSALPSSFSSCNSNRKRDPEQFISVDKASPSKKMKCAGH